LTAGGFMIYRFKSSGVLLGTAPPAIVVRDATPARLGPIVPLAPGTPGTPGMMWQVPHGFWAISAAPSAGEAPPGAGGGGAGAGAGGGAPGAGEAPGLAATPGDGTADATAPVFGCGAGAAPGGGGGAAAGPACCCCSHCWKS